MELNNGVRMPQLGLGLWETGDGEEAAQAVSAAIAHGYRSIDTAAAYGNESGVGQGIARSGIGRTELFVTTKVWNADQGYDSTLRAFETSLGKLGLDYIDLYLIHWPGFDLYTETWKAMERLYAEGRVRAIGVSNFEVHHLENLLSSCTVVPSVNQVELHPLLNQQELRDYCRGKRIAIEAWSPIMKGKLDYPAIRALAAKHGKTPAQIVLRWDIQLGVVTIPKTVNPLRMRENADIFDFTLSTEDMDELNGMNANLRFGHHPDTFFNLVP